MAAVRYDQVEFTAFDRGSVTLVFAAPAGGDSVGVTRYVGGAHQGYETLSGSAAVQKAAALLADGFEPRKLAL